MRHTVLTAVAALALGASAFTNAADVGGDRVFFHCTSSGFNTNVESAVATFDDVAPEGALGSGSGGCFSFDTYADSGEDGDAMIDSVFVGTYDGSFDELALHVYGGSLTGVHGLLGPTASITLVVDGEVVFQTGDEATPLTVTGDGPFPGTQLWEATLTRLDVGPGEHEVQLTYSAYYTDDPQFVMWDGSDAASGLTFNPDSVAGNKVVG